MTFTIENVNHSYRDKKVLSNVSFSLEKGNLMTIIGPNGVGKTTLLKSIVGIFPDSIGRMTLDGDNITNMSPRAKKRFKRF